MTSPLLPATRAALAKVRPCMPLFSNMIAGELFDARNTRGPLRVLPRTDGKFVIVDSRLPMGKRTCRVFDSEADAHECLIAAKVP